MYFKFTEQVSAGERKLKYEAVLIEAMSREEAFEILLDEFPASGFNPDSVDIEDAGDITRAKSMLETAKSFIIIHSAKKMKGNSPIKTSALLF